MVITPWQKIDSSEHSDVKVKLTFAALHFKWHQFIYFFSEICEVFCEN